MKVAVNDHSSDAHEINKDVHLGSLFGHTQFLQYITDLNKKIRRSLVNIYIQMILQFMGTHLDDQNLLTDLYSDFDRSYFPITFHHYRADPYFSVLMNGSSLTGALCHGRRLGPKLTPSLKCSF